jgi:hypothetical protein
MYTTHGDRIEGTRLGSNPPVKRPLCGGVRQCPDCRQEAAAVMGLTYYREEKYDSNTRMQVVKALLLAGVDEETARKAINVMEDDGILFRERKVR